MTQARHVEADLVVVGGGLAGTCAALAAARGGLRTVLVHERPVLGGVASSEMRVTVHGAACHHPFARETGIISELLAEERRRNHEVVNENGWTNSVFDQVLYDVCLRERTLTLLLNSVVTDVEVVGAAAPPATVDTANGYYSRPACPPPSRRIAAVQARTLSAEVETRIAAPYFVDATGDGLVADRAGCAWRMGSEARSEYGEIHAADLASTATMGNSIHIRARDIGREAPFTPPPWAVTYEDASFFYDQGRKPTDPRGGFWWIEIGVPWHTIHDNETIRHELTRHALGVWDWMKNRDPVMRERCRTFALDFLGQVPGKRESRRILGHHWLTEGDLQERRAFPDTVLHGGWFIDLHTPGGLLAPTSEPAAAEAYRSDSAYAQASHVGPYGVPLRSLIARDVDNLFLAGRCLSASRAALGSVRVMGTTALMGQAVGTAAAVVIGQGLGLDALARDASEGGPVIRRIQQDLLRDGVFLPGFAAQDASDLARRARISASSELRTCGLGPEDPAPFDGLRGLPRATADLTTAHAQAFWCDGVLDQLSLRLDHAGGAEVDLHVRLVRSEGVWDYRKGGSQVLAEGTLRVAADAGPWITWDLQRRDVQPGWLRLETEAAPGLAWRWARGVLPGACAYRHLGPQRWRGVHGALALRWSPAQGGCAADRVISGVTRPVTSPDQWCSDPAQGLPQWLELQWEEEVTLRRIQITFPGQILGEVHREDPFFIEAQLAREYLIEADGEIILRVNGNVAWSRRHELDQPRRLRCLRVVILATHGAPSAAVCEIRCFA